jgi:tRNA modification GTPase
MNDTIFALATAPGRAAVAVMRLSGPGAGEAAARLAGPLPPPREARLRTLRGADGAVIDRALVLWFPGPDSYTGEDSAELHLHGGAAVVDGVTEALAALGLRLAEPGEFTRRAFEHGRMDLSQAEAVADLVDAETEAQRRQALAQLGGALGRRHEAWRDGILEALALLDAAVDFPDEELPEDLAARARPGLARLREELDAAVADAARGERVRDGYRIAIVGAPNAGKSSLLNWLAGRDAAIVTATPGTTRDVIEIPLLMEGFKVVVADTAGVRESADAIEAEGVRRARAWAEAADLRLWLVDAAAGDGAWREAADLVRGGDLVVLNKAELAEGRDAGEAEAWAGDKGAGVARVSVSTGAGLEMFHVKLTQAVTAVLSGADFPAATRRRHRESLAEARDHLDRALAVAEQGAELAAEDVRLAGRALGRITGKVDAESVLGRIFSSFCIGK